MHPIILKALGLCNHADHELSIDDKSGLIYVCLAFETDTTDEVWASVKFTFDIDVAHHAGEIWCDDGYIAKACHPYSEIERVYDITWYVDEVDGGAWTPSDFDKVVINQLIADFVCERGDGQIQQCGYYEYC